MACSHMKTQIYEWPIETNMDLVTWIAVVASDIQEMHGVFGNMCQFLSSQFLLFFEKFF